MALNNEREAFLHWGKASRLMPRHVRVCLNNKTGDGQIKGFDELFVYLARTEASDELREKVLEFFSITPALKRHLKPSRSCFYNVARSHLNLPAYQPKELSTFGPAIPCT